MQLKKKNHIHKNVGAYKGSRTVTNSHMYIYIIRICWLFKRLFFFFFVSIGTLIEIFKEFDVMVYVHEISLIRNVEVFFLSH